LTVQNKNTNLFLIYLVFLVSNQLDLTFLFKISYGFLVSEFSNITLYNTHNYIAIIIKIGL